MFLGTPSMHRTCHRVKTLVFHNCWDTVDLNIVRVFSPGHGGHGGHDPSEKHSLIVLGNSSFPVDSTLIEN